MGLIPRAIKNLFARRSMNERNSLTMLRLDEAPRWEEARARAAEADVVAMMKTGGFKLDDRDNVLLKAAQKMLTVGRLTEEERLAAEAVAPQLFTLTTGDGEDPGFRRITSIATLRDLNPLMHDRMLQVCYFLAVTTPFGKRIVEILTEYTLGKGLRVTAKDPRVQAVIDDFWKDEVNDMDANVESITNELTIFGEMCTPVAVNPVNGDVRIGYIDPMNIDTIQFAEMATAAGTASINVPYAVRLRREVGEVLQKPMLLIRRDEDPNSATFGRLNGECFYWTLNKVKSASRGFSELFSLADWIDLFDQMIFDFGDKVRFLNSFVWHYIVEGAGPKEVDDYKNRLTKDPPRQGGVMVTNEKVKIEAQTPDFKGADMAQGGAMIKKYGLGGAGIPMVLTGDGDDANRAAALEMNAPFVKKIQKRQNHLARCLTQLLNFVIDQAQRAGVLPAKLDPGFTIEFPEIAVKDLNNGAKTLAGVGQAMTQGVAAGWVTDQTAARAFHTILAEIGVDIEDSQEEYEAAQQEKADRAAKQQDSLFSQSQLAAALQKIGNPGSPSPNAAEEAGDGPDADLLDEDEARTQVN
ncbi:MAG TPA: hypothetical protein VHX37_13485 [Acidobacteriaceae bacterium]|jgi:hypothetical protein|nr:hypothetical protein [Acidobacteriaceae bacterium]